MSLDVQGMEDGDFVGAGAIRALGEKIGEARNWVIPMQVRLQMELQLSVNGFLSAGCFKELG